MDYKELFNKFEKDILTEDVKSAITQMIEDKAKEIQADYDTRVEKLTESVGIAMDTAIEDVKIKQKEIVIEQEKVKEADLILENHKNYIEKFGIKAEVVEPDVKLKADYDELKKSYNDIQTKLTESETATKKANRDMLLADITEGMTAIQKETMDILTENIEFDADFEKKINKFKEVVTKKAVIKENEEIEEPKKKTSTYFH